MANWIAKLHQLAVINTFIITKQETGVEERKGSEYYCDLKRFAGDQGDTISMGFRVPFVDPMDWI